MAPAPCRRAARGASDDYRGLGYPDQREEASADFDDEGAVAPAGDTGDVRA